MALTGATSGEFAVPALLEPWVPADSHPSTEQLVASVSGQGDSGVQAHVDSCTRCQEQLSQIAQSRDDLSTTRPTSLGSVTLGEIIGGKYRVERVIGVGGMGSVVLASHLQLNQPVALKFMLPMLAADVQAADRFLREARAAVRLSTPHVGRVIDLDSLPSGVPYLVMEYLEGVTVAQVLKERKTVTVDEALRWMKQACTALAEAHGLGIVHRDFKPGNLFLTRWSDGSELLKVLDFGIAKSVHPDIEKGLDARSTQMLLGSPPYMSPEQANSEEVDARSDVWSCGVVLYEMLAGELPFPGATFVEIFDAIRNNEPKPLQALRPDVHPALSLVVHRCLSKQPAARYANAQELKEALLDVEWEMADRDLEPPVEEPLPTPTVRRSNFKILFASVVLLAATLLGGWVILDAPPQDLEPIVVPLPPPFAPGEVSQVSIPYGARPDLETESAPETGPRPSSKKRAAKSDAEKLRAFEERR